jgi:hypothetical protein
MATDTAVRHGGGHLAAGTVTVIAADMAAANHDGRQS